MEQSRRLAATASRFYRVLCLARNNNQAPQRRFASVSTGRTTDPHVHSEVLEPAVPTGKPEEMKYKYEPETAKRDIVSKSAAAASHKGSEPLAPPRAPCASCPRPEHIGVNKPVEPHIQQKRKNSSTSTLEETSCDAGIDGTPWPKDQGEVGAEDENDYYRHHKASPLSEIEFADTRKPITRVTDRSVEGKPAIDVIGWLPEQLDTAEEALERARRIWAENAMRGDPDSPHGRALRVARGEWF